MMKLSHSSLIFSIYNYFNGNIYFTQMYMEDINITFTIDCADSFVSMDLEWLNAIEYDIKFDLVPDCCNKIVLVLIFLSLFADHSKNY